MSGGRTVAVVVLLAVAVATVGQGALAGVPESAHESPSEPVGDVGSAGSAAVPASAPATFEVSGLTTPTSVTLGPPVEFVKLTANVTNTGDENATKRVVFFLDRNDNGAYDEGEEFSLQRPELDAGETRELIADIDTGGLSVGTYTYGVWTPDGAELGQLTVEPDPDPDPAVFFVSDPIDPPERVTRGAPIDLSTRVDNFVGEVGATKTVAFRVDSDGDGELTDESNLTTRSVQLDAGAAKTVEFTGIDTSGFPLGSVVVGFTVPEDDTFGAGRIEVVAEPTDDDPDDGDTGDPDDGDTSDPDDGDTSDPDDGDTGDGQDDQDSTDGDELAVHYQIDLVEGEPIEQFDLSEGRTYHGEGRFVSNEFVSDDPEPASDDPVGSYESEGCVVRYSDVAYDPATGVAVITVSVADSADCEGLTLSLAGHELPRGENAWTPENAEDQELADAETVTLAAGESATLTVNVDD
jgi:hypothetical protein